MTNKTYDILAYIQRLVLPAVATLIATLGQIWGWEWPVEQTVLTITAVDTFLGVVLKISSDRYYAQGCAEVPDTDEQEGEEGVG